MPLLEACAMKVVVTQGGDQGRVVQGAEADDTLSCRKDAIHLLVETLYAFFEETKLFIEGYRCRGFLGTLHVLAPKRTRNRRMS